MNFRLLKTLMKEQLFPALVAFVVALIALLVSCMVFAGNTAIEHRIEIWIYGCEPLDFFLPLLASLPFSFTLYYKKSDGFLHYSSTRMSRKRYVAHHMLAGFLLCMAGIAMAYFCGLLFSEYILPFEATSGYHSGLESYVFGDWMISHPVAFGLVWCLWKGVNAGLFTLFGYGLALYAENVFIVSVAPLSDFNRKALSKLLRSANLKFHPLVDCQAYVYLWKGHPLAQEPQISFQQLERYPCLAFDQGDNSSFYFAEEILSTSEYPQVIKANDRATMLNLMVGLNGYTLCSGIICEELNGDDFMVVPFSGADQEANSVIEIGYVTRENTILSQMGEKYISAMKEYLAIS